MVASADLAYFLSASVTLESNGLALPIVAATRPTKRTSLVAEVGNPIGLATVSWVGEENMLDFSRVQAVERSQAMNDN
jgi:hypothetical protein